MANLRSVETIRNDRLNVYWIAKDGCIFTKEIGILKGFHQNHERQVGIAFNLGAAAEHIVQLHNLDLERRQLYAG